MEQDYLLNFNLVVASFDYFFLHFQGNHIAHSYSVTSTKHGGFSLTFCFSMYQFCLKLKQFWYMPKQSLPNDWYDEGSRRGLKECPLVFLWSGELNSPVKRRKNRHSMPDNGQNTTSIECRGMNIQKSRD